jgi:tetratricopeptide (TPR) repeat protein
MTNLGQTKEWTRGQAALLFAVCLGVGIVGGWSVRGLKTPAANTSAPVASAAAAQGNGANVAAPAPSRLKEMADAQAAPLVEKLKADPKNPDLLIGVGNLYYDAQQYPIAVDYYGRALDAKPSDAAVRTDMGTAYWYMGDADRALAEFDKALSYAPNNPNTLFNRGLVKWKGKKDGAGATADWQKLLALDPNYAEKDQVNQMLAEVRKQTATQSGISGK